MANSAGLTDDFKTNLLNGLHAFGTSVVRGATTADTFYFALYQTTATISKSTGAYTASGEVSSSGYTAGGKTAGAWNAPNVASNIAFTTPTTSVSWTAVTFTTDCALLYNFTASGKNSVGSYTFGSQSPSAGNFTLTMPGNTNSTALIQIA